MRSLLISKHFKPFGCAVPCAQIQFTPYQNLLGHPVYFDQSETVNNNYIGRLCSNSDIMICYNV